MTDKVVKLGPREQQIADLLLQGCDNDEIAKQLHMARRTVKAHFNRLFLRFGIGSGIKRVKLATLLYRRQICSNGTENALPANGNNASLSSSLKDSKTERLPMLSELQNTSSKTTCESSTTNLDSGTGLNSPSGMKLADMKSQHTPNLPEHETHPGNGNGSSRSHELMESWEQRILDLNADAARESS
jgi:hypothetical protein